MKLFKRPSYTKTFLFSSIFLEISLIFKASRRIIIEILIRRLILQHGRIELVLTRPLTQLIGRSQGTSEVELKAYGLLASSIRDLCSCIL